MPRKKRNFFEKIHDKFYEFLRWSWDGCEELTLFAFFFGFVYSLAYFIDSASLSLIHYIIINIIIAELLYWTSGEKPKKKNNINDYVIGKKVEYITTSIFAVIPLIAMIEFSLYLIYTMVSNYLYDAFVVLGCAIAIYIVGYIWLWLNKLKFREGK